MWIHPLIQCLIVTMSKFQKNLCDDCYGHQYNNDVQLQYITLSITSMMRSMGLPVCEVLPRLTFLSRKSSILELSK